MKPDATQTAKPAIDFTSLAQPLTAADITVYKQYRQLNFANPSLGGKLIVFTLLAFFSLPFLLIPWSIVHEFRLGLFGAFVAITLTVAVGGAAAYAVVRFLRASTASSARLYRFAQLNKLGFIESKPDPGYSGMIFNEGDSRKILLAFIFPGRAEIGNYSYSTGSGKNRQTHTWGYARVKLPRKLPHMVLDAKANNTLGMFSNLSDTFNKEQVLSLEGDFDKHFTLYAPKEYERDALYVFTPDVMAKLIDNGGGYDMEVVEDELFIYSSNGIRIDTEAGLTQMLGIVDVIGTELREQTDFYADERVGDRMQNVIAEPGKRLKRGINWVVVLLVIFFVWQFVGPFIQAIFAAD